MLIGDRSHVRPIAGPRGFCLRPQAKLSVGAFFISLLASWQPDESDIDDWHPWQPAHLKKNTPTTGLFVGWASFVL
jgi:hypothetical protein